MAHLRIGSRGSQLALWQATHVAQLLQAAGHSTEIVVIKTTGDKMLDVSLAQVGTKGMFIKEIEEALSQGNIDLAVHSLKDVPTDLDPHFVLAAMLKREDARDAFVSRNYSSLEFLPAGAKVGTSSLRRQAQLKTLRPDLVVEPLRGNVDTRLSKLATGSYDAIILAASGLKRLDRSEDVRELLSIEQMCPAAGQGTLALETRSIDSALHDALKFLDHAEARRTSSCERALLAGLGGGCQVPIGAHASEQAGVLRLSAVVARPDGSEVLREQQTGRDAQELGRSVAQSLLERGAQRILDDVYGQEAAVPQQP
jgi:hydroxymethylbilane synthase